MWQVKATQNKAKPRIPSFLPTGAHHPQGRCSASPGQQGPIMVMVTWAQNHYCSEHPPHSFFPTFYTGHDAPWSGIPLGAVGHPLVQLCVPPSPISSATPRGAELASALCQCCSARTPLNYHHVLTNPSHGPVQSLARIASLEPDMLEHGSHTPTLQPLGKVNLINTSSPSQGVPGPGAAAVPLQGVMSHHCRLNSAPSCAVGGLAALAPRTEWSWSWSCRAELALILCLAAAMGCRLWGPHSSSTRI